MVNVTTSPALELVCNFTSVWIPSFNSVAVTLPSSASAIVSSGLPLRSSLFGFASAEASSPVLPALSFAFAVTVEPSFTLSLAIVATPVSSLKQHLDYLISIYHHHPSLTLQDARYHLVCISNFNRFGIFICWRCNGH